MKPPLLRRLRRSLDGWSVPHFLFGVVSAMVAITFEWSLLFSLITMIIIAIMWEYFERYIEIRETSDNSWVDIILPVIAFGLTLLLVDQAPFRRDEHIGLLVSVTGLFLFVNAAAWKARFEKDRDFLH